MPDKNDKTKAEEQAAKQKALYDAVTLIANHYQEQGKMVFLVATEGLLIASGQRWELAGTLGYYADYFKTQTSEFLAKRDDSQMKMMENINKAKAEAEARVKSGELPSIPVPSKDGQPAAAAAIISPDGTLTGSQVTPEAPKPAEETKNEETKSV